MSLLHTTGGADTVVPLDASDVFSTYLYTGNGNGATQTINNGIDLAGKGGLVWLKSRGLLASSGGHSLWDTVNTGKYLASNTTAALQNTFNSAGVTKFNNNGFRLTANWGGENELGVAESSWTFRKAPKFFDVVTFNHTEGSSSNIPHSLTTDIGMLVIKKTDSVSDWYVHHVSTPGWNYRLNTTAAKNGTSYAYFNNTTKMCRLERFAPTGTYVAYLFAHDTSADGIIQCGSFTTDGSGNATVNLGWEPQYLLFKGSSHATNWYIYDQMRGFSVSGNARLFADTSDTEDASGILIKPTSTGFTDAGNAYLGVSKTYIYMAIRRPMKVPTSGTEVYKAIVRTGTAPSPAIVTGAGFIPDLIISRRTDGVGPHWSTRLMGVYPHRSDVSSGNTIDPELISSIDMDGFTTGTGYNANYGLMRNYLFKRAKGFLDIVVYTGDGSIGRVFTHNLGTVPELIIIKCTSNLDAGITPTGLYSGSVWQKNESGNGSLFSYNSTISASAFNNPVGYNITGASISSITVSGSSPVNRASDSYIAYIFGSIAGISNIGSYTGNGGSQTINAGFSTGAKFILIKRTDAAGNWYVWDSVRGIVAANDPYVHFNLNTSEVTTDDSIDPESSGFIVNQNAATNINLNGADYIYLAIA